MFGGPSLFAVVQLLQITLHVEHLLLRDKKKKTFVKTNFTLHDDDVLLSVSGALSGSVGHFQVIIQDMEAITNPPIEKETG